MGRWPAILGLCLATFFLGWGIAFPFTRSFTLESHARQFAEAWLKLVAEGDLEQADQLRKPAHSRLRSVAGRKEFYQKNPDALVALTTFFGEPVMRDYIAQGTNVKVRFDSEAGNERSTHYDRLTLKYTYGNEPDGSSARSLWITVKREVHGDHIDWQLENIVDRPYP